MAGQVLWYMPLPHPAHAAYQIEVLAGPLVGVPSGYQYRVGGRFVPDFCRVVSEEELFTNRAEVDHMMRRGRFAVLPGPRLTDRQREVLAQWAVRTAHNPEEFYQAQHVFMDARADRSNRMAMNNLARRGWVVVREDRLINPFILGGDPLKRMPDVH